MPETIFSRVGATRFDGSDLNYATAGTLTALDPGRDILLALFKQAIESELGGRFDAIKASTQLASADVVESDLPLRPNPELMTSLRTPFPLLACFRSGTGVIEEHTLEHEKLTQPWELVYTLGPLPPEDIRRLGDILSAIPRVVMIVVRRRGHPDFDSGALQFFEGKGHFAAVRVVNYEVGQASFAGGDAPPTYWTCAINLETVELVDGLPGETTDFDGASYSMGVGNEGGVLPNVIEIDTETVT